MTERVPPAPVQTLEPNAADRRARETRVLRHHTVWWICVLAVLAIGVFQVYDVVRRHDIVMQTTERDFTSLVRVLAEQTARAVQAVDVVVRDTAADAGAIAVSSGRQALQQRLRDRILAMQQVGELAIIGPDGAFFSAAGPSPPTVASAGDRR